MGLFLEPVKLEKRAMRARLSDDVGKWDEEITRAAYEQLPYLEKYETRVQIDRQVPQRGYGFGSLFISNKTRRAVSPTNASSGVQVPIPPEVQKERGVKEVRVPLIIKENQLSPLDVFIDPSGKFRSLSENALQRALFRPESFDAVDSKAPDKGLIADLYPPIRTGDRGLMGAQRGVVKNAAVINQLPEVAPADITEVRRALSNPQVMAGFKATPETRQIADNTQKVRASGQTPSPIVQVYKIGDAAVIRKSDPTEFSPTTMSLPPSALSDEAKAALLRGGSVALSSVPYQAQVVSTHPADVGTNWGKVIKFGRYKVMMNRNNDTRPRSAYVFPFLLNFDGSRVPLALAITRYGDYALQSEIYGEFESVALDMPSEHYSGEGVFYFVNNGTAAATVPVTVQGYDQAAGTVIVHTQLGQSLTIKLDDNVKKPMKVEEGKYLIPSSARWMACDHKASLSADPPPPPEMGDKEKNAHQLTKLSCIDGRFFLTGPGTYKLAHEYKQDLDQYAAEFTLLNLGFQPTEASDIIKKAAREDVEFIAGPIVLKEEVDNVIRKHSSLISSMRRNLVKEASALSYVLGCVRKAAEENPESRLLKYAATISGQPDSVDKILSLNFIRPENVRTYVKCLPLFSDAESKLAELLTVVRIGLPEVDEDAVSEALKNIGEVNDSLKVLRQSINEIKPVSA